jgi:hypothetical protein
VTRRNAATLHLTSVAFVGTCYGLAFASFAETPWVRDVCLFGAGTVAGAGVLAVLFVRRWVR